MPNSQCCWKSCEVRSEHEGSLEITCIVTECPGPGRAHQTSWHIQHHNNTQQHAPRPRAQASPPAQSRSVSRAHREGQGPSLSWGAGGKDGTLPGTDGGSLSRPRPTPRSCFSPEQELPSLVARMGRRGSSGPRGRLGAIPGCQATRQKACLLQSRERQVADPSLAAPSPPHPGSGL